MKRLSVITYEYWVKLGLSKKEAQEKVSQIQKQRAAASTQRIKNYFSEGQKFGKWSIDSPLNFKRGNEINRKTSALFVLTKCECGKTQFTNCHSLRTEKTKSCRGCYHRGNKNVNWAGYKDMPGNKFYKIARSAKHGRARVLPCTVTKKFLWDLFEVQNHKCALTGLLLDWKTASLDRIDSSGGYTPKNVQWVHSDLNWMKWSLTQDRFIELCKLVVENFKE